MAAVSYFRIFTSFLCRIHSPCETRYFPWQALITVDRTLMWRTRSGCATASCLPLTSMTSAPVSSSCTDLASLSSECCIRRLAHPKWVQTKTVYLKLDMFKNIVLSVSTRWKKDIPDWSQWLFLCFVYLSGDVAVGFKSPAKQLWAQLLPELVFLSTSKECPVRAKRENWIYWWLCAAYHALCGSFENRKPPRWWRC